MATIKIKRGTSDPTATQVTNAGELAANTTTPKIWLKTADDSSTTPIWVGAQIEASPGDWTSAVKLATQSAVNTTFMPKAGGTFTGAVSFGQGSTAPGEIRLLEDTDDGSNYSAFRGSARSANITYVMPTTDPTAGQVLSASAPSSNVSTLSWTDSGSASTVTVTDDDATTTLYPMFSTVTTGSTTTKIDSDGMTYNASTDSLTIPGDLAVNGADITTTATGTATVFNTNATTVNMAGAATTATIGYTGTASSTTNISTGAVGSSNTKTVNLGTNAGLGTINVNIGSDVLGTTTINSSTLAGSSAVTTQNVFNTNHTTVNAFGAATTLTMGATSGATTSIRGGTLVGNTTTQNVFNTTATTVNAFGAGTAVSIGATTGTTTVRNDLNIASGKVYQINATSILSATTLGSSVVSSSLTSVGTIATGVWEATDVGVAHGGTGTSDGSITGTGALTFTAGGTNTNVNLVPNGTGTVDVGSKRITNLATPSSSTDAATRGYVDSLAQGLHVHATAKGATTATLASLSGATVSYSGGTQAITWTGGTALTSTFTDGVSFTASTTESSASRILVKNEGDVGGLGAAYNGIYYVYGARELRRSADANTAAEYIGGDFIFILEGTTYNNTGWVQTEVITTLDTDSILWDQFSGAGTFIADEVTLTKSGDTFSIKSTYIGQSSITTLGTIGTGTWQGTVIGLTYGGTGKALTASAGGIVYTDADSMEVLAAGTSGYVLTSGGSGAPSWTNATDANTTSAIVQRDGSGNFSAGTITASLTGTASNASAVTMASETSDTTCFLAFVNAASASSQALKYNSSLAYNSSTNYLDVNIDGGTY
jgi:hypothetical protein